MKNAKPISEARSGDVVCVDRGLYRHYGVYEGDGRVIDISTDNDNNALSSKHNASIRNRSLQSFLGGDPGYVDNSPGLHSRKKTLKRARAEVGTGRNSYDLIFNNCEHKAREWQTGKKQSRQVENAVMQTANVIIRVLDMFT